MKAGLNTIVIDKKGSEPKHNSNVGRVTTQIEGLSNGSISVDAYQGQGDSYKRREDAEITIYFGAKESFKGTLKELIEKLSK